MARTKATRDISMSTPRLDELSTTQLVEAADKNFVVHSSWAQQRTAGMYVIGDTHLLLTDSGLARDTFNLICRARLTLQSAPARIQEALAYFRSVDRPFA